jgi:hypothetical protein
MVRALHSVEKLAKAGAPAERSPSAGWKDASVEQRLGLRTKQSTPVLTNLREKFPAWKEQLLPKHPTAEAINCGLGQWRELNVFRVDGAVPIDNNISAREMKRVVLNRKNSPFVGNARTDLAA